MCTRMDNYYQLFYRGFCGITEPVHQQSLGSLQELGLEGDAMAIVKTKRWQSFRGIGSKNIEVPA